MAMVPLGILLPAALLWIVKLSEFIPTISAEVDELDFTRSRDVVCESFVCEARYESTQALFQRRSSVHVEKSSASVSSSNPPEGLLTSHVENDLDTKFLAGVPVYNYGYVKQLARCEEANSGNCKLELLQFADKQDTYRPVHDVAEDWEADLLHDGPNDGNDDSHPYSSPPFRDDGNDDGHASSIELRDEEEDDEEMGEARPGAEARHEEYVKPGQTREWLVKMRDGISDQMLHRFCHKLPGNAVCTAQGHPTEGGIPLAVVKGTEEELEKHLRLHSSKTEYVELDLPMNAIPEVRSEEEEGSKASYKPMPNDDENKIADPEAAALLPGEAEQRQTYRQRKKASSWGLDRIDQRRGLDGEYRIDSDGGKGVHVYIADTGIRTTHYDFHERALPTLEIKSGIIRECKTSDTSCAQDRNGHGTHAAATIAGEKYGVAKSSTLHSVKILSSSGHGKMSYLIQALDWVATKGQRPAIFVASIAAPGNPPSVIKAIEAASAAGVVVIVAAGNLGSDACDTTPAHVKAAITVGATENEHDDLASYTNWGKCVDLYAPGSNIHSAGAMSDTAKATMTGTSMAAPHVAGAAALLLSEDNTRTPEEVYLLLRARATQGTLKGLHADKSEIFLYTSPLLGTDEIWWQSWWWSPSALLSLEGWIDLLSPGPMKELVAEGFVCCLFLIALAFMMTRCIRMLSLPPGRDEKV